MITHRIKKQILHVNFDLGSSSYEIQEQLGRICRQTLPATLEKVCNALCMEEYWIKLDKISLDLGTLPIAGFEEKIHEKATEKLAEALVKAIEIQGLWPDNTTRQKETPAAPVALLRYFLLTGALPAWIDSRSIRPEQLLERALETDRQALFHALHNASNKNDIRRRLATMVTQEQLKKLAVLFTNTTAFNTSIDALFSPKSKVSGLDRAKLLARKESILFYLMEYQPGNTLSGEWIPQVDSHTGAEKEKEKTKQQTSQHKTDENSAVTLVEIVKYFLATGILPTWIENSSVTPEELLDQVMTTAPEMLYRFLRHAPHKNVLYERLAGIVKEHKLKILGATLTGTNVFDTLIDTLFPSGQTTLKPGQVNTLKIKESLLSYWLQDVPHIPSNIEEIPDITIENIRKGIIFKPKKTEKRSIQQTEIPDNIKPGVQTVIHNAGLVILWPGIASLLETCGLTRKNAFVSEEAMERAVMLLQYAADGQHEVPEFELPLNKIFCGLSVDTPVATTFMPTTAEKAAVQELLQTIITEWSVLKGSSTEALQVNYLQRTGTLTPQGEHWQLHIERQTADVLLDRLPWGTGVIKLPWMKHILYTTW